MSSFLKVRKKIHVSKTSPTPHHVEIIKRTSPRVLMKWTLTINFDTLFKEGQNGFLQYIFTRSGSSSFSFTFHQQFPSPPCSATNREEFQIALSHCIVLIQTNAININTDKSYLIVPLDRHQCKQPCFGRFAPPS